MIRLHFKDGAELGLTERAESAFLNSLADLRIERRLVAQANHSVRNINSMLEFIMSRWPERLGWKPRPPKEAQPTPAHSPDFSFFGGDGPSFSAA